jgi:hypothetical protein
MRRQLLSIIQPMVVRILELLRENKNFYKKIKKKQNDVQAREIFYFYGGRAMTTIETRKRKADADAEDHKVYCTSLLIMITTVERPRAANFAVAALTHTFSPSLQSLMTSLHEVVKEDAHDRGLDEEMKNPELVNQKPGAEETWKMKQARKKKADEEYIESLKTARVVAQFTTPEGEATVKRRNL